MSETLPARPALRRPLILAAVCAAMFMIAVEATIVSTAMPQIAAQLGDLHLYSWVFAGFLLSQTAMTMVFGKLADLFGRKPVLLAGIAIFLVGSALCGMAWSIPALIGFRLLQGVGAGAIQPVCLTVVGDLYPGAERAKVQGYLASVWGFSSVVGPLAGGLIIQHMSWAWIFWINIPVGLVSAALFVTFLHERVATAQRHVDIAGATLFAIGIAALMVAVTELGNGALAPMLLAAAIFAVAAAAFIVQQRRARDPIISFALWRRRPIATANLATLLSGMSVIGLSTFLPMYVQGVMGRSALVAGFALTVMVLGWPIGATVASRVFPRFGLRRTLLFGAALLPLGAVPFLLLTPASSPLLAGSGSLVIGLGMGFLTTSAIVLIQSSVGWAERGAATASSVFSRNLGSTLGATVLGGVLNLGLAGSGVSFDRIREMLDRPELARAEPAVTAALSGALHWTFWGIFVIAVAALLAATRVPAQASSGALASAPK
ncbi:MDR family MFS transporter [Roseomonas sp. USHLN139]|uniref:MDR family MFS transporter n=1 Tax=Roseomonas sp. USHLN139 TaxID=3081298 RepID=UPI003B021E30